MKDDKKDDKSRITAETLHMMAKQHQEDCPLGQLLGSLATAIDEGDEGAECSNGGGPAQVATARYRRNYDNIFGNKQVVGEA